MGNDLRKELDKISKYYPKNKDDLFYQFAEINKLRSEFGHNIELVEPIKSEPFYNCFGYLARKLLNYDDYFLYDTKIKEFLKEDLQGNVVLYFNKDAKPELKHGGVKECGDIIISKWGGGNLYKHGLREVPACYGEPRFYSLIDRVGLEVSVKYLIKNPPPDYRK